MGVTTFLQHCLTGVSLGGAYALIAIGYTMVYGILRLINFAHGDIFMMAGYFMIFAMSSLPCTNPLPEPERVRSWLRLLTGIVTKSSWVKVSGPVPEASRTPNPRNMMRRFVACPNSFVPM